MSLYLCIFDEDEELDGVDVGSYSDFATFRTTVTTELEAGKAGFRFPTFILHSDCEGEWSSRECEKLVNELEVIGLELKLRPPRNHYAEWQKKVATRNGHQLDSLYDSFIDVDGEPLIERLILLAKLAQRRDLPILFQ